MQNAPPRPSWLTLGYSLRTALPLALFPSISSGSAPGSPLTSGDVSSRKLTECQVRVSAASLGYHLSGPCSHLVNSICFHVCPIHQTKAFSRTATVSSHHVACALHSVVQQDASVCQECQHPVCWRRGAHCCSSSKRGHGTLTVASGSLVGPGGGRPGCRKGCPPGFPGQRCVSRMRSSFNPIHGGHSRVIGLSRH